MPAKRKTTVVAESHCTTCGEPMDQMACCIDWHAVYVSQRFKEHMTNEGRLPTTEELEKMDAASGSDPCDDCCCGACGSRKSRPGTVCC